VRPAGAIPATAWDTISSHDVREKEYHLIVYQSIECQFKVSNQETVSLYEGKEKMKAPEGLLMFSW